MGVPCARLFAVKCPMQTAALTLLAADDPLTLHGRCGDAAAQNRAGAGLQCRACGHGPACGGSGCGCRQSQHDGATVRLGLRCTSQAVCRGPGTAVLFGAGYRRELVVRK